MVVVTFFDCWPFSAAHHSTMIASLVTDSSELISLRLPHDYSVHSQLLVPRCNADLIGRRCRHGLGGVHCSYPREHKARFAEGESSQFLEAGLSCFPGKLCGRDFGARANNADLSWQA